MRGENGIDGGIGPGGVEPEVAGSVREDLSRLDVDPQNRGSGFLEPFVVSKALPSNKEALRIHPESSEAANPAMPPKRVAEYSRKWGKHGQPMPAEPKRTPGNHHRHRDDEDARASQDETGWLGKAMQGLAATSRTGNHLTNH